MRRQLDRALDFFYGADPILFSLNAVSFGFSGWAFIGCNNAVAVFALALAACSVICAVGGFLAKRLE